MRTAISLRVFSIDILSKIRYSAVYIAISFSLNDKYFPKRSIKNINNNRKDQIIKAQVNY